MDGWIDKLSLLKGTLFLQTLLYIVMHVDVVVVASYLLPKDYWQEAEDAVLCVPSDIRRVPLLFFCYLIERIETTVEQVESENEIVDKPFILLFFAWVGP